MIPSRPQSHSHSLCQIGAALKHLLPGLHPKYELFARKVPHRLIQQLASGPGGQHVKYPKLSQLNFPPELKLCCNILEIPYIA